MQLQLPSLLEQQERIDSLILERIPEERPALTRWACKRIWRQDLVERIDRTASAAEREFYVDASGSPKGRGCLPASWPTLPAELPGQPRAAALMDEGFDLLARLLGG